MDIKRYKEAIETLTFDVKIRAKSALETLIDVDYMLEVFMNRTSNDKYEILLDVYGMLQSLFVGIDSLYQLIISTTKYKYHVNINANPVLRELKYIRNDVVGHPTNRTYNDGSYGFSIIDDNDIKRDHLLYHSFLIKKDEITKEKKEVIFAELINAYIEEKNQTLSNLDSYLMKNKKTLETSGMIATLFDQVLINKIDIKLIESIRSEFIKEQHLDEKSKHRFLWRLNLIKNTCSINNTPYDALIKNIIAYEVLSIYKVNAQLNKQKARMPKLPSNQLLNKIYESIKKHRNIQEYISIISDSSHPYFNKSIESIIESLEDGEVKKFFVWFSKVNNNDLIYLIGHAIKNFNKIN